MFPFHWPKLVMYLMSRFWQFWMIMSIVTLVSLTIPLLLFPWQNAYLYFIISVIFLIGSSLLIHMVFFAREYTWVPQHSKDTLFLSAVSEYQMFCMPFIWLPILRIRFQSIRYFRCLDIHVPLRQSFYLSWDSFHRVVIDKYLPMNVIVSLTRAVN